MVNEEEDLSRNFGLYHLLPAVNARPDIFTHILSEFDQFVIIGNRGLWDFVSYRTAVDIARLNREDPMKAAQMLRDYAMAYGADGNTVVMVVAVEDLFPNNGRSRMPNPDTDPFAYTTRRGPRPERDRLLRMLDESITPPRGSLALVFTDIRNSTSLWEKNVGMPLAMRVHNELLRRQARWIGGYEVKTEGDSFMLAFQTMPAALLWCFTVQTELLVADWPMEIIESEEGGEKLDSNGNTTARGLSVRMGVHWGRPVCAEDPTTHRMDYFGPMVNRSARVMSQALGGQIMASSDAIREIQATLGERYDENSPSLPHVETLKRMGIEIVNIGERSLKGLEAPEDLSLVLPTSLLGRLEAPTAPVPEASSRIHFNIDQLKEPNVLTLRLEALATSRIFEPARPGTQPLLASAPSNDRSSVPNALGPKAAVLRANLDVVLSNFKADAPDHDLMLLLDQITGRIENSLSTLYLRTMMHGSDRTRSRAGPPPHLEDIDPRILREAVRLVQNLLLPATTR
jgi:adenylate cyclase